MLEVIDHINQELPEAKIRLLLTDAFPDKRTTRHIRDLNHPLVRYSSTPLHAEDIDQAPGGIKTMVASFHHLRTHQARAVLSAAENSQQPLLIYELAPNRLPVILWWLFLPVSMSILVIMSWCMTPFVRPFSFSQLFFTYIIPVIPLIYAWDGRASLMRTYTFKDIEELLQGRASDNYAWTMQRAKSATNRLAGYYIFGCPGARSCYSKL